MVMEPGQGCEITPLDFLYIIPDTEFMFRRLFEIFCLLPLLIIAPSLDAHSSTAPVVLACVGDAAGDEMLTKVYLKRVGGEYSVRFPLLSNVEGPLLKVFGGHVLTVLGEISDGGAGFWVINTLTKKYSYMQTKEISKYSDLPFNADQYIGVCKVVSGRIKDF